MTDHVKQAIIGRINHAFDVLDRHLPKPQRQYFQPGGLHLDLDQVAADEAVIAIANRVLRTCANELRALGHPEEAAELESQIIA